MLWKVSRRSDKDIMSSKSSIASIKTNLDSYICAGLAPGVKAETDNTFH